MELFDTMEKPYHKAHKVTTFTSTSGSHEAQPVAFVFGISRLVVEGLAESVKKPSLRSATGVDELDAGGVICW